MRKRSLLRMASMMLCAFSLVCSFSVQAASPEDEGMTGIESVQIDEITNQAQQESVQTEEKLDVQEATGDNVYPAKSSGTFYIRAGYQGGSRDGQYDSYTINLSNIDKNVNITSLRTISATAVYTGNAGNNLLSGVSHTTTTAKAALYSDKGKEKFSSYHNYIYTNFQLNIPNGYRISQVNYSGQGSRGTLYHLYLNNSNLQFNTTNGVKTWNSATANELTADCSADGTARQISVKSMVDVFYHAGVGTTSATYGDASGKVKQNIVISPIQYSLQYNVNGGTGGPQNATVTYDSSFTLSDIVPQKTGYQFGGWSIGGVTCSKGQTLTVQQVNAFADRQGAVVTATAIWTPITYCVAYDMDGGTGSAVQQTVTYGQTFSLAAAPSKEGYSFGGWQLSNSNQVYQAGKELSASTFSSKQGDIVRFKAVWNAGIYHVAYYLSGEENEALGEPLETISYQIDQASPLKEAPKLDGWVFTGWQIDGATYSASQNVKNLTKNNGETLRAFAKWQPIQYSISYDGNGATDGNTANQDSLAYGTTYRLQPNGYKRQFKITYDLASGTLEQPVNSVSSVFLGWSQYSGRDLSQEGEERNENTDSEEEVLLENNACIKNLTTENETVTLFARWDDTPLTILLPTPVREDESVIAKNEMGEDGYLIKKYTFVGWKKKADSSGEILKMTQTITEDTDLIAVWKETTTFSNKADGSDATGQIMNKLDEIRGRLTNGYNLSDEQAQKVLEAIENGSAFTLKMGNAEYTIVRNKDGTLSINVASLPAEAKTVSIPSEVKIGTHVYPITEIYKECFKDNKTIEQVVIGNNIVKIGDKAFGGCTALRKLTLSEGLITIGNGAFEGCKSLTRVKLPMSLQTIGNNAFQKCSGLKTLTMQNGLLTIGNYSFYKCVSLTRVRIPDTVIKMGKYTFASCTGLKTVITSKACTIMGEGVFYECRSMEKLTLKDALTEIPAKACMGCKKLAVISIPKKVMGIRTRAFYCCSGLKTVKIKSTYLTAVGKEAFKKCGKKIQFTVPAKKKKLYADLLRNKY